MDTNGAFEYSNMVSVERASEAAAINVYPNPTTGTLNYNIEATAHKVILSDSFGKQIRVWEVAAGKANNQLSIEDLPAGIYVLSIQLNDTVQSQKIVKQ